MGYGGILVEVLGYGGCRTKRGAKERANLVVEYPSEWEGAAGYGHEARRKAP
jgi:hypothetical protein